MSIEEIAKVIEGKVVARKTDEDYEITHAFASDLMSDVLTINNPERIVLLTGLANVQTIRTVEMANLNLVVLVRGKKASEDMIELAKENDIVIIESKYSAFRASAVLYNAGIKSLF
jgi:predicted transcriptional regulator